VVVGRFENAPAVAWELKESGGGLASDMAWYSPARRRYMSHEAQREEKKNLLLEWTENEEELARQRATAARMADVLDHVAGKLRSEPEGLVFSGDSTPLNYVRREMVIGAPVSTWRQSGAYGMLSGRC
jgi:hypothetical protein